LKRFIDLTAALLLLILLTPLLAAITILIANKLGSPVIFKQLRPGLHGRPFYLYKFRTMTDCKDENGNLLPDDIRLKSFGKWLRKYSLDELPQFFNVIKGDLSFVGPRPLLMEYLPLYSPEQARRHKVRPGITGWAQVNGRNAIGWEEKFALDIWYVDNHTLWLDFKILLLTIIKAVRSEGINQEGYSTMPKFKG
jgi:sugar transferase EpsL